MNKLKISKKNLLIFTVIISGIITAIILSLLLENFVPSIILIGLVIIIIVGSVLLNLHKSEQAQRKKEEGFVDVFNIIKSQIVLGKTLYKSISDLLGNYNGLIKSDLEIFLISLESDASLKPFMEFSSIFKNGYINEIMISLYQMMSSGVSEIALGNFTNLFDKFKAQKYDFDLIKEKRSFENKVNYALVGSGVFILGLMIAVISTLGMYMNG